VPTVWPTNKNTKCRVERHKPTCLKETLCLAFKNKDKVDCVFLTAEVRNLFQRGQTVNQDVYRGVLQHSCKSVLYCHPEFWATGKWFLPHNNVWPHTALSVKFLSVYQIIVLVHEPYSPHL
jgi:hypothetical protein